MKKAIVSALVVALVVIAVDVIFNAVSENTNAPVLGMSTFKDSRGGMDALGGGTLTVEGSCLFFEDSQGGRTAPIFPFKSAKWEDGGLVVGSLVVGPLVLGGQRYEVGEEILLGGGERSFRNLGELHQDLLPECRTPKVWIVAP